MSCLGSFSFFENKLVHFGLGWFEETWNLWRFYSQHVKIGDSLLCDFIMHFFFPNSVELKNIILDFICYLHSPRLLQLHKCRRCSAIWITAQQFARFRVKFEFQWVTSDFNILKSCWYEASVVEPWSGPVSRSMFNKRRHRDSLQRRFLKTFRHSKVKEFGAKFIVLNHLLLTTLWPCDVIKIV